MVRFPFRYPRPTKLDPQTEYLITLEENGNSLGLAEKAICHQGDGILHSAFLVMIFDQNSALMQAKRSRHKTLWPGFWDGTVAGHFVPGKSPVQSLKSRVFEEVGVTCGRVDFLSKFFYQARYKNVGIEKEICHVFATRNIDKDRVTLNGREVSDFRFMDVRKSAECLQRNAAEFTPWFLIAFEDFLRKGKGWEA